MTRGLVVLVAFACGQAVAGTFYAQPLLDAIAVDVGIGHRWAGVVIAATQVGYAVGLVALVPLGDVVERRRLILVLLGLGALSLVAAAAAGSAVWLLAAMAGVGLFAVVIQLLVAHAVSLVPAAQRGQVVGAVTSGVVLGIVQARTLGPLGDWRTVYFTGAGLMLLAAGLLLRLLPSAAPSDSSYAAVLRSLPKLYADVRPLRVRGALALLVFAALSIVWSSLVLALTAPPHRLSHAAVGLFGLAAAAGAISARRAGRRADQGRHEQTTNRALALLVLAWLPLSLLQWSLAAVAIGLVMVDLAVQAVHVTNQSLIFAARPEARSRLVGAYMVFYSVGIGCGSVAATATYAAAGWTTVCALGATVSVAALVMVRLPLPRRRRWPHLQTPASSLKPPRSEWEYSSRAATPIKTPSLSPSSATCPRSSPGPQAPSDDTGSTSKSPA